MFWEWLKGIWKNITNWFKKIFYRRRIQRNNTNESINTNEPLSSQKQAEKNNQEENNLNTATEFFSASNRRTADTWNKIKNWFCNLCKNNESENVEMASENLSNINKETTKNSQVTEEVIELGKEDRIPLPENNFDFKKWCDELLKKDEGNYQAHKALCEENDRKYRELCEENSQAHKKWLEEELRKSNEWLAEELRKSNEKFNEQMKELARKQKLLSELERIYRELRFAEFRRSEERKRMVLVSLCNLVQQVNKENTILKLYIYQNYMASRQANLHMNINPVPQFDQRQRLAIMKAITYEPKPVMKQNENHLSEKI